MAKYQLANLLFEQHGCNLVAIETVQREQIFRQLALGQAVVLIRFNRPSIGTLMVLAFPMYSSERVAQRPSERIGTRLQRQPQCGITRPCGPSPQRSVRVPLSPCRK